MDSRRPVRKIIWTVHLGFLAIVVNLWLDEIFDVHNVILGNPPHAPHWEEGLLEMLVILLVWYVVARLIGRLTERLFHLERFHRVCAWCRRIHHEGRWIPLEEFFRKGFSADTSHGMCPECLDKHALKPGDIPSDR